MQERTLITGRIGLTAITNLLVAVSTLVLLAVVTKTLSIADYGTWALVLVTATVVPKFATLGLPYTMVRFLAAARDKQAIREIFYSNTFISAAASAIVCGVLLLFTPQIAANLFHNNSTSALLFVLNAFLACLDNIALNYFRSRQQVKRYTSLTFAQAYLQLILITLFILLGYGLQGALMGLFAQQLILLVVMAMLIVQQIGFAIPKFSNAREYLSFGLPLVPGQVSSWAVASSDRYIIGLFLGTVAVGYYSPGYSLGSNLALLATPLVMMLPAILSKHYDEKNIEEVKTIMKYSLKYYLGVAIPCAFAVSVLSKPLLTILTTPEIAENGYYITPFVAAATVLVGAYEVIVLTNVLKKKTVITGTIWVVSALVNVGLNLILIPRFGIIAAALTTLAAFGCAFTLTTVYALRHFTFDLNSRFVVKSISASAAITVFLFLLNPTRLVSVILMLALSAAIYLGIMFLLRGFTIPEAKFFYRMFRSR